MAKLRPDWSKSSFKNLVARLKAAGGDTGAVYSRKRSITAAFSAEVDELRAKLPALPRGVGCLCRKKKLGTSSSTARRVLHNRWERKDYKTIRAQRISAATRLRRLACCRCVRLRLGARLRLCKGPSLPTLNVHISDKKVHKCEYLQHPKNFRCWVDHTLEAHGLRQSSPHRQVVVQSRHHGGRGRGR